MEGWQIKLVTGLLAAGVATGGGALGVHKFYAEKLEAKAAESQQRLDQLRAAESRNDSLQEDLVVLNHEHKALREKHQILEEDYRKATTADGVTYDGPSTDESWHEAEIATGDQIRFKLSSGSLYLRLVRVTHDGPIVQATGCLPRLVDSTFVSERDGTSAYLLRKDKELHLQVSCKASTESYLTADLSDLEDVRVSCRSFEVKNQRASLRFRKCFPGR